MTDPWCWYCRLCTAGGEFPERAERDEATAAHLRETPCGRYPVLRMAEAGRLMHVWSFPYSAAADLNLAAPVMARLAGSAATPQHPLPCPRPRKGRE